MIELSWVQENWLELVRLVIEIGAFIYAVRTWREDIKVRKWDCGFRLTKHHWEIWSELYRTPELSRVEEADVDLEEHPISKLERLFITFVILHTKNAYRASRAGFYKTTQEVKKDATGFFSQPIPKIVWSEIKQFQDSDFSAFIG